MTQTAHTLPRDRTARLRGGPVRAPRGVTLIELMFALTILGVLLSIAIPQFRNVTLGSRLTGIANTFHASVQLARSEAIKANGTTTLCPSSDGSECDDTADWADGWVVLDADGHVLEAEPALDDGFVLSQAGGAEELNFQPIGITGVGNTFTVCRNDPVGNQKRTISVTATGVAYVAYADATTCP